MATRRRSGMRTVDVQAFLDSTGVASASGSYRRSEAIFSQGDAGDSVFYIQAGGVKLSAVSTAGREAIVAILGPGDFFGEGSLAGQSTRKTTATALTPTTALIIGKAEMIQMLRTEHVLCDAFIAYMLSTNIRMEEDLLNQFFTSDEKGLARALLLLARYGTRERPARILPGLSATVLARTVGITPARARIVMDKFSRLGFIAEGPEGTEISTSLLSVVLHD